MARDERLGDKMPVHRAAKWGSMDAGDSHLSEEFHDMIPSSPQMSEKWVDMTPSTPQTSEKWVGMEAGTPMGDQWHELKQGQRIDPYAMHSSNGGRTQPFKEMKKETPDNKAERKTQHSELGSTREI